MHYTNQQPSLPASGNSMRPRRKVVTRLTGCDVDGNGLYDPFCSLREAVAAGGVQGVQSANDAQPILSPLPARVHLRVE